MGGRWNDMGSDLDAYCVEVVGGGGQLDVPCKGHSEGR